MATTESAKGRGGCLCFRIFINICEIGRSTALRGPLTLAPSLCKSVRVYGSASGHAPTLPVTVSAVSGYTLRLRPCFYALRIYQSRRKVEKREICFKNIRNDLYTIFLKIKDIDPFINER